MGNQVGEIDVFEGVIYIEDNAPRGQLITLLH